MVPVMARDSRADRQAAPVHSREWDAAASFNARLTEFPDVCAEAHRLLLDAHERYALRFQGRLLCKVLRPRFISRKRADELARVSGVLAAVFERAGAHLLHDDARLNLIGATEQEREIWSIDPGYPGFTLSSRLDSFMVGEAPRFVEYNAESPAGIAYSDILSDIFLELPAVRTWEHASRLRAFEGRRCLLDTLLWAFQQRGGSGTPTIAIVDWENVITKRDFELCAEYFRASKVATHITDPRRFAYRDGRLWLGDTIIDLVYRRVLLHELLDHAQEVRPLLNAYREGAVCMVNSPRSKILHKKAVFALLSDRGMGLEVNVAEAAVIEQTIPWTRLVTSGETEYHGQQVNLFTCIQEHQRDLVLKPVDEYGGRGVVLGWEVDAREWRDAIERAEREEYVVQERVPVPQAEFPVWEDGKPDLVSLMLDTSPLLFRGKMGSILTRLSGSALLNVSAGAGSTVPTFVLEEA